MKNVSWDILTSPSLKVLVWNPRLTKVHSKTIGDFKESKGWRLKFQLELRIIYTAKMFVFMQTNSLRQKLSGNITDLPKQPDEALRMLFLKSRVVCSPSVKSLQSSLLVFSNIHKPSIILRRLHRMLLLFDYLQQKVLQVLLPMKTSRIIQKQAFPA